MDIIFPSGNEKEFTEMALKLGIKDLVFCYTAGKFQKTGNHRTAVLVKNLNEADKFRKKADFIIAPCSREFFENRKVDFIIDSETINKKDNFHYRKSGLNQVLCKIARDTGKGIIFNVHNVLNAVNPETIKGRMIQNMKFCRKYKVKTLIVSFAYNPFEMRSPSELKAFENVLKQ